MSTKAAARSGGHCSLCEFAQPLDKLDSSAILRTSSAAPRLSLWPRSSIFLHLGGLLGRRLMPEQRCRRSSAPGQSQSRCDQVQDRDNNAQPCFDCDSSRSCAVPHRARRSGQRCRRQVTGEPLSSSRSPASVLDSRLSHPSSKGATCHHSARKRVLAAANRTQAVKWQRWQLGRRVVLGEQTRRRCRCRGRCLDAQPSRAAGEGGRRRVRSRRWTALLLPTPP
ncbi:hypothetical protein BDV95DRAFT_337127 [Massariosphaeria phaeospora]|uniref:Uncharacterized protein n=1 Tax=Massariosphaeria phaeospora TaxID=100035 RepID=A0A7C8M9L9_9PLEO|nr:hypothetical protein BDV95DRAFT_337127 [Massariosphaeria phaeospora]